MEYVNQLGHIQYWGISPAINFLKDADQEPSVKVLMSGCSDIRHILKTITDVCHLEKFKNIEIYFHETQKQLLCRALLFLHIIHEQNLNFDQRVELFLDLYGNAQIKEKSAKYLHNIKNDLLNLIHDQKFTVTTLKNIVDLKHLKFQERDDLSEIVQSWSMDVPFDIKKLRDQRLRYHFKQRYDFRTNLIDWDYNMMLLQFAPIVHYSHYKEWRMSGLAFQNRFSTYVHPNRTLSSYVSGRKTNTKQSCLVRGYWGDITCSPYLAFGIESDYEQKKKLFQKANQKFIGHSVEISQYNVRYYIQKIQTLKPYYKKFQDYYRSDDREKQKNKQPQKQENIKETKQTSKITEEQAEKIVKQNRQKKDAVQIQYLKIEQPILPGFLKTSVKFYPMAMNLQNLKKKKYQDFFNYGVFGFGHLSYLKNDIKSLFKSGSKIYVQNAHLLLTHKKEDRKQINMKWKNIILENGFIFMDEINQHHWSFAKP